MLCLHESGCCGQAYLHGGFPADPAVLGHSQAVVGGHRGAATGSGPAGVALVHGVAYLQNKI